MRYEDKELIDSLAAEYALGTLQGRARQRFERLLRDKDNAQLRAEVEAWDLRVNKLADQAIPVAPPAQLWNQLEQRLFPEPAVQRSSWFERIAIWRGLATGSSLLAGVLALFLFLNPATEVPQANYVVVLQNDTQGATWTVNTNNDMNRLLVRNLKPMITPANSGCLLWVQPKDSERFYPIGLLPDDGSERAIELDASLRDKLREGKLVVTLEDTQALPPTPSSPVEFQGQLLPLTNSI